MTVDSDQAGRRTETLAALKALERHGHSFRDLTAVLLLFSVIMAIGQAFVGQDILPASSPLRGWPFVMLSLTFSATIMALSVLRIQASEKTEPARCNALLDQSGLVDMLLAGKMLDLPRRELAFLPSRQASNSVLSTGLIATSDALGQLAGRPDSTRSNKLEYAVFVVMLVCMSVLLVGLLSKGPLTSSSPELADKVRNIAYYIGGFGVQLAGLIFAPGAWRQHIYADLLGKQVRQILGAEQD